MSDKDSGGGHATLSDLVDNLVELERKRTKAFIKLLKRLPKTAGGVQVGRKRSAKRARLPGEPKRPPSGYQLFMKEFREKRQGSGTPQEIMREVAAAWRELSPEEKQPYKDQGKLLSRKYKADKEEFQATHDGSAVPGTPDDDGDGDGSEHGGHGDAYEDDDHSDLEPKPKKRKKHKKKRKHKSHSEDSDE